MGDFSSADKSSGQAKKPNIRSSKPRDASRHSIRRYLDMLQIIPRNPKSISTKGIFNRLIEHGYDVSLKTVQRDLMKLMDEDEYCLAFDEKGGENYWYFLAGSETWTFPGGMEEFTAISVVLANQFLSPIMPYASNWMPSFKGAQKALLKKAEENTSRRDIADYQWMDKIQLLPPEFIKPNPEIDPEVRDLVYAGVSHNQFLRVSYEDYETKTIVSYNLHPLGLIYRPPVVYLVAMDDDNMSNVLRLAVHRIVKATDPIDIQHITPLGFSLKAYADAEFGIGNANSNTLLIMLWINKDIATEFEDCPMAEGQILMPVEDGGFELTATVPNTLELRRFIHSFGSKVVVLGPKEFREEFANSAATLAKQYSVETKSQ